MEDMSVKNLPHKLIVSLLIVLLLNACGFHLRGVSTIDPLFNPLFLQQGELTRDQYSRARDILKQAGAELASSSISANSLELKIVPLTTRKLVTSSLSSVELVQIGIRLEYLVKDGNSEVILEQQVQQQLQEVELDTDNILSQQEVLRKSRESLEKQLLRGMIFKLSQR